ncbi:50S ribosomal protein L24 [Candidatus Shapirobacteria bacterium CG09_land_8_20_14_0_10_39_12]|uniref:Large ribosomal subunit protein uL24 n=1 Tax=Candidatus Shapirobacteria bacterium CG09_land_8_20_14_0_10_39_12 TaxID=1974885 RepID=A0A2H0WP52_9BACT|nr:MAG: 50S ribosomal protein L24 [Candidatus Shapirobacteria bacterium CG09_land_8_20_14_0_10_39_12]
MKIKKGDKVKILIGKDAGRTGTVEFVLGKKNEVLVGGLNIFKKHAKPRGEGDRGGIIDKSRPLNVAKVALICPKCGKTARVGYRTIGGKKNRICLKCKTEI